MIGKITTKQIGDRGERIAADHLRRKGYRVKARNFRAPHGEIDIVAENREYLVFAEVKSRKDNPENFANYGRPCEAVTADKQKHILSAARVFLQKHPTNKYIRFDVIEVYLGETDRVEHIEDAFRL